MSEYLEDGNGEGASPLLMNPCPFCGANHPDELGVMERKVPVVNLGDKSVFWGACSCGAQGPDADSREEAIAKWNRRSSWTPPTSGEVKYKVTQSQLDRLSDYGRDALQYHNSGTNDLMRTLIGLSDGQVKVPEFVATVGVFVNRAENLSAMLKNICSLRFEIENLWYIGSEPGGAALREC